MRKKMLSNLMFFAGMALAFGSFLFMDKTPAPLPPQVGAAEVSDLIEREDWPHWIEVKLIVDDEGTVRGA